MRSDRKKDASWHCAEVCITRGCVLVFPPPPWLDAVFSVKPHRKKRGVEDKRQTFVFNFYVNVLLIYDQNNIHSVYDSTHIYMYFVQFAQKTRIKIHWLHLSKLAAAVGTVAAHWPYGKCQSGISS